VGLIRDIRSGAAGIGTRLAVSLAMASALSGLACIGAYGSAVLNPRNYGGRFIPYVRDEELLIAWLAAGLLWLAGLVWVWSPQKQKRPLLIACGATLAIALGVTMAGVAVDEMFTGDEEFAILGIFFVGLAAAGIVWTWAARAAVRRKPVLNDAGEVQVHCVACGYDMTGLREARCPECGRQYTIDELIAAQRYAAPPAEPEAPRRTG